MGLRLLRKQGALLALVVAVATGGHASAAENPYDLLIRGGTVIDGTGARGRYADVAVRGARIVAIGRIDETSARETIDATGLIVAPGFIDAHNHVDASAFYVRDRVKSTGPILNEGFLTQGVTTIVGGPDGGYAPAGLREVIGKFEQAGIATNYAFYVGHNGVRSEVMGSAQQRRPTQDELRRMVQLVEEGMQMGAVGLSTGLMYEPGMFSETAEVVALAKAVKPFGGVYDSHVRDPVFKLLESDQEAIEVGRQAGIPVKIAHEKAVGLINEGRTAQIIKLIESARAAGREVVTDQYPYDGAATTTLAQLLIVEGMAATDADSTVETVLAKAQGVLRDSDAIPRIRAASENGISGGFSWIKAVGYGSMRIVDAPDFPELVGRNIQRLAQERGTEPFALIADLIRQSRAPIWLTLGAIEEQEVRQLMQQPWNMIASDGSYVGADGEVAQHPRSTGTFTRVLGHYVREQHVLTLAAAIRKMTSMPADFLGLYDRGRIAPEQAADITIFDARKVRDTSTWAHPQSLSQGIVHVIVNGRLVLKDGEPTGAAPGKILKRQRAPGR